MPFGAAQMTNFSNASDPEERLFGLGGQYQGD